MDIHRKATILIRLLILVMVLIFVLWVPFLIICLSATVSRLQKADGQEKVQTVYVEPIPTKSK